MRIKYKGPNQFFFRRFWRVAEYRQEPGGAMTARNQAGRILYIPAGMVVIVVTDK